MLTFKYVGRNKKSRFPPQPPHSTQSQQPPLGRRAERRRRDATIFLNTKETGVRNLGRQQNPYDFRPPTDPATPGRKASPVREGVAFTPMQIPGRDPVVVMDYELRQGGEVVSYRLPLREESAYRVLAGVVHDPTLPRQIAADMLDTSGRSVGSAGVQHAFERAPIGQTEIFDAITTDASVSQTAAANQGGLFPSAESYIQYPARNFGGVYQGPQ
jgi:hypothetical protein